MPKVETAVAVENRKRFKGVVNGVDTENNICLTMENTEYKIPFEDVAKAKIVITDELLKEYEEAQAEAEL